MSVESIYKWIKILSLIGIVLALYLLFEQITQSPFKPCNINSVISCEAIISGGVANTFGIPTPLYGLVGFIIIFFFAVYKKRKVILPVATFGLIFCSFIAYKEIFELNVVCLVCLLCHLIMISTFLLSLVLYRKKIDE